MNQRRFTAAGNAGHDDQAAQRKINADIPQVVLARATHRNEAPISSPPDDRSSNRKPARKIFPGERVLILHDLRRSALRNQGAPQPSCARTQINHIIGTLNRLGIVFDHQNRIAQIAKLMQRIEQPSVVTRMQTDRRFVEHIQNAAQLRTNLCRQPDALCFTT